MMRVLLAILSSFLLQVSVSSPGRCSEPPDCARVSESEILSATEAQLDERGLDLVVKDRKCASQLETVIHEYVQCMTLAAKRPSGDRMPEQLDVPGSSPVPKVDDAICIKPAVDRVARIMQEDTGVSYVVIAPVLNLIVGRIDTPKRDEASELNIFWRRQYGYPPSRKRGVPRAYYSWCNEVNSDLNVVIETAGRLSVITIGRGEGERLGWLSSGAWQSIDGERIIEIRAEPKAADRIPECDESPP